MHTRLIHIAPQLPPNLNGVGDYAVVLGRRVAEQTDGRVQSAYVSAGIAGGEPPHPSLDHVDLAGQPSAGALCQAVRSCAEGAERACVLLHYVGYGYQRRGCPLWLVRALRRLRSKRRELRLVTMFHELYATSRKPWTSVFWLSPAQRYVAARLARLSDGLMANLASSAGWLRGQVNGQPVRFSPTFSNVGEPEALPDDGEREPHAVAFGAASRRSALYEQHGAALSQALKRIGVEKIVDIGPPVSETSLRSLTLPVERAGFLPAEEVSRRMKRTSVGVLRYDLNCMTKSGIVASYAAHGLLPVVAPHRKPVEAEPEQPYVLLERLVAPDPPDEKELAATRRRAKKWYDAQVHSKRAARRLTTILDEI